MQQFFDAIAVGDTLPISLLHLALILPWALPGSWRRISRTIDEMNAVLAQMPEGCRLFSYATQADMLSYIMSVNIDNYVDWSTGDEQPLITRLC